MSGAGHIAGRRTKPFLAGQPPLAGHLGQALSPFRSGGLQIGLLRVFGAPCPEQAARRGTQHRSFRRGPAGMARRPDRSGRRAMGFGAVGGSASGLGRTAAGPLRRRGVRTRFRPACDPGRAARLGARVEGEADGPGGRSPGQPRGARVSGAFGTPVAPGRARGGRQNRASSNRSSSSSPSLPLGAEAVGVMPGSRKRSCTSRSRAMV